MSTSSGLSLRQPRAVWAVAFACVIAFMGIGLVDPILKPIADELGASPSQVSLLFTSYMAVMGVAMLLTGVVSSRIGAKRTLLAGLALIIVFAALAGASDTVGAIVGFRAGWGLGNALFIATALSTIVVSAQGSVAQAVILFEAALGLGIAMGPIVGGQLGSVSWRAPFFGVAVLMTIALVATAFLLPRTPPAARRTSLADPFRALRFPGLLTIALTALFYNVGFFTLLAFTPFPLDMGAAAVGWVFFGWGLMLAFTSVWVAPVLQRRFGAVPTVLGSLSLFAADLAMMAVLTDSKVALVVGTVLAGAFLGVNNTVITEAVMGAAPVERSTASAAYSFVRFSGGAVAPYAAGRLGEEVSVHAPFWMGAAAVAVGVLVLLVGRRFVEQDHGPAEHSVDEGELVAVGDLD
ncbi:MFS transporter [Nocardioides marmoraquaticus]